jgi:hypothetical protein
MKRQEALEIYKLEHARYNNFREIQWKMNVSIWTLLALAIRYADELKGLSLLVIISASFLIVVSHMIFVYRSQWSLKASRDFEKVLEKQLNGENDPVTVVRPENISLECRGWFWFLSQWLTTLALTVVFVSMIFTISGCYITCS